MLNQLWNLAIWRQSAVACLSFFFYHQTCLWCMITHQYAAGGHETIPPLARWKAAPLTSEICRAASDESHMGYHSAESVDVFLASSLQFAGCLSLPHVVIYPLMTTLGSERTVVPLSTLLMSDTSKLALMLSRKDLALVRGVNNRFMFVRRTKTQLSPCASASVEHLKHLVAVS